ncbi:U32 family peptidase [Seongchinamella sediminis]|uniref:Ubiquinone biosynthesis protein UbiU n=1 Tax=Seongchinamella sediminis TaxID=2283635 RepID=A0A3L7DWW7_9GAMM|nr:peptidase U32 family protein [Seongchinamella sediminis]RLQ21059.1 U32 family peptidase [Seongchinamella sediminis]
MELVCPAGNYPMLKAAVDNGADAVYIGFKDDTNARHFAGLNFNDGTAQRAVRYAQDRGRKVFVAINTYPQPSGWERWQRAVDLSAELGVDALIIADTGVLAYAATQHPGIPRHLSVQGSATNIEALRFYSEQFGIRRAVIPRVLSLSQVEHLAAQSPVELEVFGFGSLCVMVEGRCLLSSYATGESPNTRGACSPASAVRWEDTPDGLESRLNGVLIDRYQQGDPAGYPVVCKGRFDVAGSTYHAIEEPTSLNTLELLPQLQAAGIGAIKIEGRQRSVAYIEKVARVWREAIDRCAADPASFRPEPRWMQALAGVSEGTQTTLGAYHRPWQ